MLQAALSIPSKEARLLAPDEPAPVELVNRSGRAPLLLLCDHASAFIPRALANLGLSEADLARHIAFDIGIADVTREVAARLDAPAVLSHFSRLIIDPNRDLADPTLIPTISDGVIVPGNRDMSAEDRQIRYETFFRPYHEAIEAKVRTMMDEFSSFAFVSMHSYTPVLRGVERPWQVGVLWHRDGGLAGPLLAALRAQGLCVGDNEPYSARGGHASSLQMHAARRGLPSAVIEVRQDLIDTRHGAREWAELLGEILSEVLGRLAIHRQWLS